MTFRSKTPFEALEPAARCPDPRHTPPTHPPKSAVGQSLISSGLLASHWQERLVLPGVELYLGDCLEIAPSLQGVDAVISDPPYGMKLDTDNSRASPCPELTGLQYALCALAFFRKRHVWKERGSRRGLLVKNRIKDLSRSGENRAACRAFIRDARRAGFRGRIISHVCNPNAEISNNCPKNDHE